MPIQKPFPLALILFAAALVACGPPQRSDDDEEPVVRDGGPVDGGSVDGGSVDGGSVDGGSVDAGGNDGGEPVGAGIMVCLGHAAPTTDPAICTQLGGTPASVPEIDLGPVAVGIERRQAVRIHNRGETVLEVRNATVIASTPEFQLAGGTFSGDISAHGSVEVEVLLTAAGEGPKSAMLRVPSSDPAHPTVELPVRAHAGGPRLCVTPPGGVDFGRVAVGDTMHLSVYVENCGQVAYPLNVFKLTESDGTPGDFTVDARTLPSLPKVLAPGDELQVELVYAPRAGRSDSGSVLVATPFESVQVPIRGSGDAPDPCGDGRPVAMVKVFRGTQLIDPSTTTVQPHSSVAVDGGTSIVAGGDAQYAWALVRQPVNGTATLAPTGARSTLDLQDAGEYEVELVVKDALNCTSAPARVTIRAAVSTSGGLAFQLTWAEAHSDLDLHYVGPGGSLFDEKSDAHWGNRTPDWGSNGTTQPDMLSDNDPTFDLDALWGNGPEVLSHDRAFAGTYRVVVHDYCSRQGLFGSSQGAATATLRVLVDGVVRLEQVKSLTQRDAWEAAIVTVTMSGSVRHITVTPSTAPVTKTIATDQSCTMDGL